MESLKDSVVIITGASAGIGRGTAIYFSKLGCKLSLTGQNKAKLDETVSLCTEAGLSSDNILTTIGDLRQETTRKSVIDSTIAKFSRLDVLINNAGTLYTSLTLSTPEENYDDVMDVNMKAPFLLTQLAAPHLIQSKGCIVNVSSICGSKVMPEIGVYCMSKAALDMFTQCVALELAPKGVRVNAVNPGTVVSDIHRRPNTNSKYSNDEDYQKFLVQQGGRHPLGRVGQPEDVAKTIAYLASDQASYITGQLLYVDGGRHCVTSTTTKPS
ncbi:hypothetical protein SNE40_000080 [Patella caerulea]|uniref:Uncharacterized protein n=1 Tax=Patella caerulea TaxID=87958 RepID=A0AAN8KIS5_PATCE